MKQDHGLLRIENLSVTFPSAGLVLSEIEGLRTGPARDGKVTILDEVSFAVGRNEITGLVGESGSGKTLTSLTVMGFLPPSAQVTGGHVWFQGMDLLRLGEGEMQRIRGQQIAMIFQSTRSALNPLMRVGDQVARAYQIQRGMSPAEAYQQAVEILGRMDIPQAERRARAYPHQLSGGMCQRVLIAMMIACEPALLIADEPTTGLDVTIQAQIFELIKDVQKATEASILLITHDLGVIAETCRYVVVMYAGQVMETAPVESLFARPLHPYTQRLLQSVLRVDRAVEIPQVAMIPSDEVTYGVVGCRFAPRCSLVLPRCWEERPLIREWGPEHWAACHRLDVANCE
ncbi:MAG: ABC transporter ATP-binding protein [Anaerolineales bacterium]|nr:MAG: ABC transporter ATP-binding protein [Anaerolineales bacterium]